MSRLLVAVVAAYRVVFAPLRRRSRCLFAVSCSEHVEHEARVHGFLAGLRAVRTRVADCRPGYSFVIEDDGNWQLECRSGTRVPASETSAVVRHEQRFLARGIGAPILPEEPAELLALRSADPSALLVG